MPSYQFHHGDAQLPQNPLFAEVEKLKSEQKFQEALTKAEQLYADAKTKKDDNLTAEALIRVTDLMIGLSKMEEAVLFLKNEPKPNRGAAKVLLDLYYGDVLGAYFSMYNWQIQNREKTASKDSDIKTWTTVEISAEILKSYSAALQYEEIMNGPLSDIFLYFVSKNTYPKDIRPTVRDFAVYSAAHHLSNSAFWSARESNEYSTLPFSQLIKAGQVAAITDSRQHPLARMSALLLQHKSFHVKNGRVGAALEAQYVLFEKLLQYSQQKQDRAILLMALSELQTSSSSKKSEWWTVGQALWAQQLMYHDDRGDRYIQALSVINTAIQQYPNSYGAKKCVALKSEILRPNFNIQSMNQDGDAKASIQIQYKNIPKIHFRAYSIDIKKELATAPAGELWGHPVQERWINKKLGEPVAKWTEDLAPTKDMMEHMAYAKPRVKKKGAYLLLASIRDDFSNEKGNLVQAVPFVLTDIVLQRWSLASGIIEVRAVSGETGLPLSGVTISNWARSENNRWDQPASKKGSQVTGASGMVEFAKIPKVYEYFQFAEQGDNYAYLGKGWSSDRTSTQFRRIIVLTDRSIFRPQQKIQWKVMDFNGDSDTGQFQASNKQKLIVELYDANRKVVASRHVTTNEFGTAAGEFIAAKDKALGGWQIIVRRGNETYGGSASIRVEEYKRPTFEVTIKESLEPLRLNQKAVIGAEARYYFGQPLSSGSIKWRVERTPVWSWWSRGFGANLSTETIATGSSKVSADGSFKVEFTAKADEREKSNTTGLHYSFKISADVTDDGGETRQGSKTIQLGFVSLDAQFHIEKQFFNEKQAIEVPVVLSDLNGQGKSGSGIWQILKVTQPSKTVLPAELPLERPLVRDEKYMVPGDTQRPRWDTQFDPAGTVMSWADGSVVAQGVISHDNKGKGQFKIPAGLEHGVYRIVYKSKDEFGAELKVKKDIFVVGNKLQVALPLLVLPEKTSYEVGETARVLVTSGLADQNLFAEVYAGGVRQKRFEVKNFQVIELPITSKERGGFSVLVTTVRDYQVLTEEKNVVVPWTDKNLNIEMATFRDKIRPGAKETIKIVVKDAKGKPLGAKAAEVLAFMYDRSLDFFSPHTVPSPLESYASRVGVPGLSQSVMAGYATSYYHNLDYESPPAAPVEDHFVFANRYGIGGPGSRGGYAEAQMDSYAAESAPAAEMSVGGSAQRLSVAKMSASTAAPMEKKKQEEQETSSKPAAQQGDAPAQPVRSDFSETAFWQPHLLTGADGSVAFEYQVPDSLTSWTFWTSAATSDIRAGLFQGKTQSIKDLMVRPYLPRFLREGDAAEIKVMINNAGSSELNGNLELEVLDADTGKSVLAEFSLDTTSAQQKFTVPKDGSSTLKFAVKAPRRVGMYSVSIKASSKSISDGEKRVLPVLPSRMHLAQSRFVTLRDQDQKVMEFADMAKGTDSSLITDRLVLTVDAQLFYGVLQSLPYLINYPYECAEQTLNRFLSTGIITEVFKKYPAIKTMAQEFSKRKTALESFDTPDANRRMIFEESPWLQLAEGRAKNESVEMAKVLDSRIALAERERSLKKLRKMQTNEGGFPWFDGGRPDEYMTLYVLVGFARAHEFGVAVPKDMVVKAWKYVQKWSLSDINKCIASSSCHEFVTLLNFTLSSYPDDSWTGGVFSAADKKRFLDHSFAHWKKHSPLLKGYLALTLKRMDRYKDAQLVWASVMDSAKSTPELGTYWAPEERSWLWYNDTIETHAFALRVQMEMAPADKKNDGLVQWLFLNKKLNHWKSTKATAESIYSLVHYLDKEKSLGVREQITATIGGENKTFTFEPDKYTGAKNQIVVLGDKVKPERDSKVKVSKSTKGFAFASSTWHFSTEKIPEKGDGDMFSVTRKYFIREMKNKEWTLKPLSEGGAIKVGDQVEVHIALKAKHAAEYVHLRDPRGAGFEPEEHTSEYRYDLGLAYYQEVRDSGGNFFFNRIPVGLYTFKYRVRANMSGTFRVGPATVQSLYAPEFNAYSQGDILTVKE